MEVVGVGESNGWKRVGMARGCVWNEGVRFAQV